MLLISTVHAETFPRYLDTVHSLSRSASFHATRFFFPLRQILRSRVSAALVVDISNDTQQFGWRSPQRHTTTTHHALPRHTSLLHTWLVFFATVSGFAFTASYQHPRLQTESRMLMRSREGRSRQSVNHYTLVFESTIVKGAEFGIENPSSENPSRNGCPILHDIGKKKLRRGRRDQCFIQGSPQRHTSLIESPQIGPRLVAFCIPNVTLQTHQILRLPRKMTMQHLAEICEKQLKRHFQCAADPSMIREWSDHVPRPFASVRNPPRNRGSFSRSGRTVCIEKYNISRSGYLSKFHQVLRLPRKVTLELHQVLRLPRKMTLELHQVLRLPRKWHLNFTKYCAYHAKWHLNFTKYCAYHEKWHLTFTKYCAYHAKWHLTFTKYCACHTEWLAGLILVTYETSFPMCGETNVTLQTHQILRLPRKITMQHLAEICEKQLKRHFQCAADPSMIREWSDHVPRPFPSVRNPPRNRGYFSRSRRTVCIEKYNISRSGYLSKFHQVLRLPRKVTLELHQVLRLPRKVTLDLHQVLRLPHRMTRRLDPRHIWNVISNVRRNKCHTPNSPNTAPATQNDHATSGRNLRKTAETSFPMRGRSEHDPRMIRSRSETVCVSPQPATQQRLLFALQTNGLYWKIQHFALRLSFQISPSTAPTTKSNTWTSPSTAPTTKSNTWTSPSTAPTTKSDTWPSPSTAPATQNDSQAWSSSHMKRHFQCAEKQMSHSKLTKYCACHAKWPCNIWQKFAKNSWNVISNARPIRAWSENDPITFRDRLRQSATRHATEVTFRAPDERFVLKNTTFRAPAIFPNFTKYCAYHEK